MTHAITKYYDNDFILLLYNMWSPSNTWFPGPTQVLNPNGSSIGAAVFAGLTSVTDRPTDHATRSVRIGRIYVRSTAMRPKNTLQNVATALIM